VPTSIATVLSRIPKVPNQTNAAVLLELHDYMRRTGAGVEVLSKVFCSARKAFAKVEQDASILVRQEDLVSANLVHASIECQSGAKRRQGWGR